MPSKHLIKEINQREECPYCKNDLKENEWKSLFDLQKHYKETPCGKCGEKILIRMHFDGSGHDCWDQNGEFCKLVGKPSVKTLEEKIRKK